MSRVNRLQAWWQGFFHGPQAAVRPYLLARILPCMLALDIWMLMIGHAGRYGAAGFNVAHFSWLDALMPLPTSGMYIGLLLVTGLLALYGAITRLTPAITIPLTVLYTLSWSMSMLDSYQHHYFLSLVLVCMAGFPPVDPATLALPSEGDGDTPQTEPLSHGFGYPLMACTIAIVYAYAALAKCDSQWLEGYTIRRISQAETLLAPLVEWAAAQGVASETFWSLFATSVVPLEGLLAFGYLVCSQQDRVGSRPLRLVAWGTFALGVMLHAGAEAMDLDIGWFSYYMIVLAAVYALPARGLRWLAQVFVVPSLWLRGQCQDVERDVARNGPLGLALAVGVAGIIWLAARNVNLPGAEPAGLLVAAALLVYAAVRTTRGMAQEVVRPALASMAAAGLMWLAIDQSEVRWDFYRYLGGDLMRRGHLEAALQAYETGEQYAPPGQTRQPKIDKLRRQLGQ